MDYLADINTVRINPRPCGSILEVPMEAAIGGGGLESEKALWEREREREGERTY